MDKAKLELSFGHQGGLKSLCEAWTGQRLDSKVEKYKQSS